MTIADLTDQVEAMVRSKGWYEAGSPHPQTQRNVAASLAIEAAEVLEHYQWSDSAVADELAPELADVLFYLLQLARLANIDLVQAAQAKLAANAGREWPSRKGKIDDQG